MRRSAGDFRDIKRQRSTREYRVQYLRNYLQKSITTIDHWFYLSQTVTFRIIIVVIVLAWR